MKLVSFRAGEAVSFGVVNDEGIVDLAKHTANSYRTLRQMIAADALGDARDAVSASADYALAGVTLLPPIPDPDKIICVGLNYEDHRIETGREPTGYPVLFTRFANTQVGHRQPLVKPNNSDKFDYEGELAVIIGKPARHVSREAALDHVAGYACYNDGSIRDWQGHTHQFTPGKNFPATGGFGPWMVTADAVPDPSRLRLTTRLNSETVQEAGTDQMIFNIPYLISYISDFTELAPGDVIVTGTPGGVGFKRKPPLYMKAGDRVEVEISGIGTLENPVIDEG